MISSFAKNLSLNLDRYVVDLEAESVVDSGSRHAKPLRDNIERRKVETLFRANGLDYIRMYDLSLAQYVHIHPQTRTESY